MSVDHLIRAAMDSGIHLTLVDGEVKARGKLAKPMIERLRMHRAEIIEALHQKQLAEARAVEYRLYTALAVPAGPKTDERAGEQPAPPPPCFYPDADWHELAAEYHTHHFNCPTCIAAGQGRGLRCGTGSALWVRYQDKVL